MDYYKQQNSPVIPLPNPGEGGPTAPNPGIPVIPLPNPGEGGPTAPNPGIPVIPLPNPGEGGPTAPGPGIPIFPFPPILPIPNLATTRFLNAAYGYPPFQVMVNNRVLGRTVNYGAMTNYAYVPTGYQTVTVSGLDGYIYVQKTLPFQSNIPSTIAIINSTTGMDLLQIMDSCCAPTDNSSNFRVSNLAYYSKPIDVLLRDGRVIYSDVQFKETTAFKRIRPCDYEFIFAYTNLAAMPYWQDIESMNPDMMRTSPPVQEVASIQTIIRPGYSYTAYLLNAAQSPDAIQTFLVRD